MFDTSGRKSGLTSVHMGEPITTVSEHGCCLDRLAYALCQVPVLARHRSTVCRYHCTYCSERDLIDPSHFQHLADSRCSQRCSFLPTEYTILSWLYRQIASLNGLSPVPPRGSTHELRISLFLSSFCLPSIDDTQVLLRLATWTNMRRSNPLHTLLGLPARQVHFASTLAPIGGKTVSAIFLKASAL